MLDAAGTPGCCFESGFVPAQVITPCCPGPTPATLQFGVVQGAGLVPFTFDVATGYWHVVYPANPPILMRPIEARMHCRFFPEQGLNLWSMELRYVGDSEWLEDHTGAFAPICSPFTWVGTMLMPPLVVTWSVAE